MRTETYSFVEVAMVEEEKAYTGVRKEENTFTTDRIEVSLPYPECPYLAHYLFLLSFQALCQVAETYFPLSLCLFGTPLLLCLVIRWQCQSLLFPRCFLIGHCNYYSCPRHKKRLLYNKFFID